MGLDYVQSFWSIMKELVENTEQVVELDGFCWGQLAKIKRIQQLEDSHCRS